MVSNGYPFGTLWDALGVILAVWQGPWDRLNFDGFWDLPWGTPNPEDLPRGREHLDPRGLVATRTTCRGFKLQGCELLGYKKKGCKATRLQDTRL